jgi:hypothetical protein
MPSVVTLGCAPIGRRNSTQPSRIEIEGKAGTAEHSVNSSTNVVLPVLRLRPLCTKSFRQQPRVVPHLRGSRSSAFRRPESHGTGCNKASNRGTLLVPRQVLPCCLLADVVHVDIMTRAGQRALNHPMGGGTLDAAAYSASGRMRRGRLAAVRRARREFIQGSTVSPGTCPGADGPRQGASGSAAAAGP